MPLKDNISYLEIGPWIRERPALSLKIVYIITTLGIYIGNIVGV